ncbi:MAG: hypothetical protein ABR508_02205 [Candidatus Baltobacteraceae bacterium]
MKHKLLVRAPAGRSFALALEQGEDAPLAMLEVLLTEHAIATRRTDNSDIGLPLLDL